MKFLRQVKKLRKHLEVDKCVLDFFDDKASNSFNIDDVLGLSLARSKWSLPDNHSDLGRFSDILQCFHFLESMMSQLKLLMKF